MKLGFICVGLPGHLNPMTALARQLQARNHEVVFLYSSGAGGLPFVCGPEKDHINEKLPEISKKQGLDALQFSLRVILAQSEAILKSLPAVVQENGVDALIIDAVQFYAEPECTMTTLATLHFACLTGPMRQLLQLWPEIEKVS
jgi:zeaxanthin glucosyltransferase